MATNTVQVRRSSTTTSSSTTSPALQHPSMDEWDVQLGGLINSPGTRINSGPVRVGSRGSAPVHLPPPAATPVSSTPAGQHQQRQGSPQQHVLDSRRFVRIQMIRAAVSAMVQCGMPVSPGLLDSLNHRSDRDLDATCSQIEAQLAAGQMGGSGGRHLAQPRCPSSSALTRDLHFDPQGHDRDRLAAMQTRPHAPIPQGHLRGTPQYAPSAAHPSPPMVRNFSTPAAAGAAHQQLFSPAPRTVAAAGDAPAAAAGGTPSSTSRVRTSSGGRGHPNNSHYHSSSSPAAAEACSDGSTASMPKPQPLRMPYDPRFFPTQLQRDGIVAHVHRHVTRSASSAFSQASTQSSTFTQGPRNMSEEMIFPRSASSSQ